MMPVLDLTDWVDNAAATRIKIFSLMMYPNYYTLPYDSWYGELNAHELLSKTISSHFGDLAETEDGETFFSYSVDLRSFGYKTEWNIASKEVDLSNVTEFRWGQEVGWVLWTIKRLQDIGHNKNKLHKAIYILKKDWEKHHPGKIRSCESVLDVWQRFEHVAHLWAAYGCPRYCKHDEVSLYSRFDLSFLEDDLPAFLARAEVFREFGEAQRVLSPEGTWAVPKEFPLLDAAIDVPPLTDDENAYLAEYDMMKDRTMPKTLDNTDQIAGQNDNLQHSEDFTSVCLNGQKFVLTPNQAAVIKALYESYQRGLPDVRYDTLLVDLEIESKALSQVFKSTPGSYKALIAHGSKKGTYRLNV